MVSEENLKHNMGLIGAFQDGWGGEGTYKISEDLIRYVHFWAQTMMREMKVFEIESDFSVDANTDGTITLLWAEERNPWHLEINFQEIQREGGGTNYEMAYYGFLPWGHGKLSGTAYLPPRWVVGWMHVGNDLVNNGGAGKLLKIAEERGWTL